MKNLSSSDLRLTSGGPPQKKFSEDLFSYVYCNIDAIMHHLSISLKTGLVIGSVADPDPGSGDFLTLGSGIGFFPDPGSQTHIFERIVTIF